VIRHSFACTDRMDTLRGLSLTAYRESVVSGLGGLVLARYRAVRLATDLLLAGLCRCWPQSSRWRRYCCGR
jgi:hypothetical protein